MFLFSSFTFLFSLRCFKIAQYEQASFVEFAGTVSEVAPHTLKINIAFKNWPFNDLANTLVISMDQKDDTSNYACVRNNYDVNGNLVWFSLNVDGTSLYLYYEFSFFYICIFSVLFRLIFII